MENKEVQKSLSNIKEGIFDEEDIHCISEYIEQLELDSEELHWCIEHTCNFVERLRTKDTIYKEFLEGVSEMLVTRDEYMDNVDLLNSTLDLFNNLEYRLMEAKQ